MSFPEMEDVLRARNIVRNYLQPTPFHFYPSLSEMLGCEIHIKHENHQPIGAFKVRGGIYLASQLSETEKTAGLITASTGNHGQSIAYAGKLFGVQTTVAVPDNANPLKVGSIRSLGAEVIFHGRDFDDARVHVEELSRKKGYRYVHSANEPCLIAGVATYALEMLEARPDLDIILVPIGGGSGASGCGIVVKTLQPRIEVIGVQAEAAPAAFRSWKAGRLEEAGNSTFAEGLATRTAFELTQAILREHLDDFVLVSEESMHEAIILLLEKTGNLAEGAGAATTAAAVQMKERLKGKKVGLVMSGGNLSLEHLRWALGNGR